MDDNKGFINKAKLNELFIGKEVFLYGLGQDCEIFLSDYDHGITVKGFIDSYRYGTSYFGKSVISPDQFIQRFKGTPIVIMALKYVREIRKKLERKYSGDELERKIKEKLFQKGFFE